MRTSWDCFDTLITRRRYDPLTVFDDMGARFCLEGFTSRRKAAEARAPETIHTIYAELAKDYGWGDQEREYYKQAEIELEKEHCCPIVENLRLVKEGDIVVSDMYLPEDAIRELLVINGLNVPVDIYVTTGGKRSRTIWPSLPHIDLHVGDNYESDVASPNSVGIEARFYDNVHFSASERKVGGDLALLMRLVRLANPHDPETMEWHVWNDQAQFNIPALILASLELPESNVAFVMRDGVHLQPIYEAVRNASSIAFHCSRIALKEGGKDWLDYVKAVAYGKHLVDLQGTGKSVCNYWQQEFNCIPEMTYLTGTLQNGRLLASCNHDAIEKFNSSPLGTLVKFPNRLPCEFDKALLNCQAAAVSYACSLIPLFTFERNLTLFQRIVDEMQGSYTARHNIHIAYHENQ